MSLAEHHPPKIFAGNDSARIIEFPTRVSATVEAA
jgi:hypothetical protein